MKVQSLLIVTVSLLISITAARAEKKPLKVFILAGQSNMCEQGSTKTFPAIEMDPKTAPMLKDMVDAEGNAVVCEQAVWALGNIAGDGPKYRDLTVDEGIVKPLLALVAPQSKSVAFLRNLAWTVSNLCRNKNPHPKEEVVRQCLPAILTLLQVPDSEIQGNFC